MDILETIAMWVLALIFLTCIGVAIWLPFAVMSHNADRNRLIEQCMADGRKEYECKAMFISRSDPMPMPIVIPMVR